MKKDYEYILNRLNSIFSKADIDRISSRANKEICLIVDVHGMKCFQAKKFITNIINVVRIVFRLIIIHGYNHGTAIKDMLSSNYDNCHISFQYADPYNQGITHMLIAA